MGNRIKCLFVIYPGCWQVFSFSFLHPQWWPCLLTAGLCSHSSLFNSPFVLWGAGPFHQDVCRLSQWWWRFLLLSSSSSSLSLSLLLLTGRGETKLTVSSQDQTLCVLFCFCFTSHLNNRKKLWRNHLIDASWLTSNSFKEY